MYELLDSKIDGVANTWWLCFLQDENTALHIAATLGNRDVIKALLQCGADPSLTNSVSGQTSGDYIIKFMSLHPICTCVPALYSQRGKC